MSGGADRREDDAELRENAPQLIGQSAGGKHIYYDETGRTMFEGTGPDDAGDERLNERPLGEDAGVEGIVDTVNDREGWNWLSEFTQERLPDFGAITGDDTDERD